MYKRVDKAAGKRDKTNLLKRRSEDETTMTIDQLADESSGSESDSDSESSASSSQGKKKAATTKATARKRKSADDSDAKSDASSSEDEADESDDEAESSRLPQEGPAVTIAEALADPIYVPTDGDKKHGELASKCILCNKVSLKSAHLIDEHLKGKSHLRRLERFNVYITEQMSEKERKVADARDAVDEMDEWTQARIKAERKAAAAKKPEKAAAAGKLSNNASKKEALRERRRAKKNLKRQAKRESLEANKIRLQEDPEEKKARKKAKYGGKGAAVKSGANAIVVPTSAKLNS